MDYVLTFSFVLLDLKVHIMIYVLNFNLIFHHVSLSCRPGKETKNARKRRKRREMANQAADDELAEISIEQQVLKKIHTKQTPGGQATQEQRSGNKTKHPISLNLADMINALEVCFILVYVFMCSYIDISGYV